MKHYLLALATIVSLSYVGCSSPSSAPDAGAADGLTLEGDNFGAFDSDKSTPEESLSNEDAFSDGDSFEGFADEEPQTGESKENADLFEEFSDPQTEEAEKLEDDFAKEFEEPQSPDDQLVIDEPLQAAPEDKAPVIAEEPQPEPEPLITEPESSTLETQVQDSSAPVEITNIEYKHGEKGGTVLIESTGLLTYKTRINSDTHQYVIEIANSTLPDRLKRPYILKEFNSPFAAVNAYQSPGSSTTRVVIQLKGEDEPMVQEEAGSLMVFSGMVQEQLQAQQQEKDAKIEMKGKILNARSLEDFIMNNDQFYGDPINLQFKDADIRDVINMISQESGVNIVLSEGVKGNVTVKMREVPWDQALVIIMRSKGLGYIRQGSVLRVATLDQLREETEAAKRMLQSQQDLTPLKVKVIPVSYGKVDDMLQQIMPFLTPGRGKIIADKRTSSLVITDTESMLDKVTRLIAELDIPPAQVMIEGKIVEAGEEFKEQIGINWSALGGSKVLSADGGANGGPIFLSPSLRVQPISGDSAAGGVGSLGLTIGTLDFLGDLNATLALAENDTLVNIISSPRVVTINKEEAQIAQKGENVTITQTLDQNGNAAPTVNRTPVELLLKVTPQITADGGVIMDVDVKREFVGAVVNQETNARPINSRSAKTKVLVKSGQTAVIGGIYQNDVNKGETGVPGLKDLPVLGWLFKSRNTEATKTELIIFLTPRILNPESQSGERTI